jgi:uncharacterized protein (DUF58 family)
MTDKGLVTLALGAATYALGWAFGTAPLYPVGVALVLLVVGAWAWTRLVARPARLARDLAGDEHVDGDDVEVRLELETEGALAPGALELRERVAGIGEREVELRRRDGRLVGSYVLGSVPRGRYQIAPATVAVEDPFGLVRREVALDAPAGFLVYPRLVELDGLFSESGARAADGRRLLLRRQSGFDLHSVREHEPGESLRRVHWPTTARRGRLMVKELEDAPRDEAVVVLDAESAWVVGEGRDTTFELGLVAAGSLARLRVGRGRRVGLLLNDAERRYQPITSLTGDWALALELLAVAEPDGRRPVASILAEGAGVASNALDLTVVTSGLTARLAERLLRRSAARRGTSLVFVDPASFGAAVGQGPALDARAQLLRLERAGVPVAVLRRGDDVRERLSAPSDAARRAVG